MSIILLLISGLMQKPFIHFPDNITKEEKIFINTVSKVINKTPLEVTKQLDNYIFVTYNDTKYLLSPNGEIEIVWIMSDNSWECLGEEVN
jgi:hypothetical protein